MTSMLAAVRPDSWNFPLFVHVLGAMLLVGGLLAGASVLTFARGDVRSLRLGYWTLLVVALPGYIVMRIGGQWIYSESVYDTLPEDPAGGQGEQPLGELEAPVVVVRPGVQPGRDPREVGEPGLLAVQ